MQEERTLPTVKINSRINNIELIRLQLNESTINKGVEKQKVNFEFNLNIRIEPQEKEVVVNLITKIFSDESKSVYLGEIETSGSFSLFNLDEIIQEHKGIPEGVFAMFAGALISSTRGFLILKTKDTPLEGAIIPIVDMVSFFKNGIQNIEKL